MSINGRPGSRDSSWIRTTPRGLVSAAAGVDGVFLMSGYAAEQALLDALSDAHVVSALFNLRVTLVRNGNAVRSYGLKSEQAVQPSGLPWTILRPCSFQSNVLRWRDQLHAGDVVRAPFGSTPTALIDPTDIAEVAATALTQPGHAGHTYRLSGPEPLTPLEQVARVAAALNRPLTFEPIPDDEARKQLPPAYAEASFDIFRDHPELESEVQPTVENSSDDPRAASRTGSSATATSSETFAASPPGSWSSCYAARSPVSALVARMAGYCADHGRPDRSHQAERPALPCLCSMMLT